MVIWKNCWRLRLGDWRVGLIRLICILIVCVLLLSLGRVVGCIVLLTRPIANIMILGRVSKRRLIVGRIENIGGCIIEVMYLTVLPSITTRVNRNKVNDIWVQHNQKPDKNNHKTPNPNISPKQCKPSTTKSTTLKPTSNKPTLKLIHPLQYTIHNQHQNYNNLYQNISKKYNLILFKIGLV